MEMLGVERNICNEKGSEKKVLINFVKMKKC